MTLSVTIKNTAGSRFELDVPTLTETIAQFKHRLSPHTGIPALQQRLIFRGHILRDTQTFSDIKAKHGLETGHTMHVVPSPPSSSGPPPSSQTSAPNHTSSTPSRPPVAPGLGAGAGAGAGGPFGMPNLQEMQNQFMQNPEQMQAVLNSPIMERIMNNPDFARRIMMANPQMRELVESNPEIAHVMNDPSTLRQMMQMARNPSLMNEMMRNSDRQMANIEMMPGGFDALRRMHETIQAPLMDAAQGGFQQDNNPSAEDSNPFSTLFQNTPSNQPMPNPWAPANNQPAAQPTPQPAPTNPNAFASLFNQAPSADPAQPSPFPNPAAADTEHVMNMLENPMMQQMLETVLNDPQMFESFIENSPEFQRMMRGNPQMAHMLRNPNMMRTLLSPQFTRNMRSLHTGRAPTYLNSMRNTPATPLTSRIQALRDQLRGPQDLPEFFHRARRIAFPDDQTGPALSDTPFSTPAPPAQQGLPAQILALMNAMRGPQDLPELFRRVGAIAQPDQAAPLSAVPFTSPDTVTPPASAAEILRALRDAMRNPLFSQNAPPAAPNANANDNAAPPVPPGTMDGFMQMMQDMGPVNPQDLTGFMQRMQNGNAATRNAPASQEQLEETYRSQLAQLREMGFLDTSMCLQALQQSRGNVSAAIENLINRFGG